MAASTFHLAMFATQWEMGLLVVVEQNFFPSPLDMAAFAFRAKAALMLVIFLVAGQTIRL